MFNSIYISGSRSIANAIGNSSNCKIVYPADDIEAAYAWLASADRDAAMGALTNTNRRCLILMPGTWSVSKISLTQYVDIVGVSRESCIIKQPTGTQAQGTPVLESTSLASDETGITNLISNLTLYGGTNIAPTTTTGRRIIQVVNCRLYATLDNFYVNFLGTRTCDIYVYSSYLHTTFDSVTLKGNGCNVRLYACEIVAECIAGTSDIHGLNTSYWARAFYTQTGTTGSIEAYACKITATSNSETITDGDAIARVVDCQAAPIRLFSCSLTSSATTDGGSGDEDGDCIITQGAGDTVSVYGSVINTTTNGYDINNDAGGTVNVCGSSFTIGNVTGTVTYFNGVGGTIPSADPADGVGIWLDPATGTLKVPTSIP